MALNFPFCLFFLFYQTPRWHVLSKWAILAEVYADLFTENILFLFPALTFSQGKGLLECFCGKIKIKSSPLKSFSHIPPAARVSCRVSVSREAFDQLSSWSFPSSFTVLSLFFTVPFYFTSGSVHCTGWEFLGCLQIFEFSFPRGSVICSALIMLVLSF